MPLSLIIIAVCLSAMLHVRAEYAGARRQVYLFKPLTMLLIIATAASAPPGVYRTWILLGLCFGIAGDIFLMLPRDRFIAGLVGFLIGHICYITAFTISGRHLTLWTAIPFLIAAVFLFRYLLPHLGKLKLPVLIYSVTISIMGWQAFGRYLDIPGGAGMAALLGAVLFIISDSVLAIDRFAGPIQRAKGIVLATYFSAQLLLALSTFPM